MLGGFDRRRKGRSRLGGRRGRLGGRLHDRSGTASVLSRGRDDVC